ncbi:MAG TPA: lyase family protein, partial [Candidatus Sulfotelmatobacter sp.]|nr:lyase family protein [Candidatus Sulfotelmatobacter sp.]
MADGALLQAMLDAETALARAEAACGLVPRAAAAAITAAGDVRRFDIAALGAAAAATGTPILPLVEALRTAVGGEHGSYVHLGATSQDIVDTALMLVTRRSLGPVQADLAAAADACARLA